LEIESQDFTFGYSLNVGCGHSRGKYIVLISAHALPVDNHWLSNLLAPFSDQKVAMVYGKQMGTEKSKFSEKRDFERLFGNLPFQSNTFLCYANNANAALRKELWSKHHFDEYLFGLEDIEWARYVTERGYFISYVPEAAIYHLHQENWCQVFNRYRREAAAAVKIGLAHPPQAHPSPFWLVKSFFQDCLASLPKFSLARLKEIGLFRYYQWKGTRLGWYWGKALDLDEERYNLYYPGVNKAVVISRKFQAELKQTPLPRIKPSEVLIEVAYVGVCRTDLEVFEGTLSYYKGGLARYPIIPGHEFSGKILRIGANSWKHFKRGDKVVGECILSRDSSERKEIGVINYNGAYSNYIVMPARNLHKIPDGMDLKTACLTEPLAVVLQAIRRIEARLKPEDPVAVIGAGSIGNLCTQIFKQRGHRVTVFDKNKNRLELLKDKAETLSVLKGLDKFNTIVEATGSKEVLNQILKESRRDVTILLLGFPYGNINYNFEDLVGNEKVIVGSVGGAFEDFEKALKLLPQLDIAPFTQAILPLEDFSKAWQLVQSQKYLKVLLKP
ncbi:MAG: alcohol dehydrogenase catalytic domain-containing protein, partial [Patescibacteria group bacterium]|nr:alcohol dehydrogenase catalytic domain-containing protein [Patescibacteria group bacterium]